MLKICIKCKKSKSIKDFFFKKKKTGLRQGKCKSCQSDYQKSHYLKNKKKYLLRNKISKKNKSDWLKSLKKKMKCKKCGESHIATLQFHHKDPSKKELSVSTMVNHNWSKEKINIEIKKCEVLCANCHSIHHWNEKFVLLVERQTHES